MMGDRLISVLTSTAQTQVVGKRHYGKKAVEAGGGGGGDPSGLNRENFQPVLLWKGKVPLDARRQGPGAGAADRRADVVQAGRDRHQRRALFGTGEASIRTAAGPEHLSGRAAGGAHRRHLRGDVHAAQRIGQADAGDRDAWRSSPRLRRASR